MGAADGLSDGGADVNNTQLGAPFNLVTKRDRVSNDERLEDTAVEGLDGVAGQDAVGDQGKDRLGAVLLKDSSRLHQGAAGVGHVIYCSVRTLLLGPNWEPPVLPLTNQDRDLVLDVANKNLRTTCQWKSRVPDGQSRPHHATNNVGPGALLVDQSERGVKVIGNGCRTSGRSAEAACVEAEALTA